MVFVSDNLDHDKTSVLVFLHKLLVELTADEPIKNDSDSDDWYDNRCKELAPQTIHVSEDDFVICRYEGDLFPGQVTIVHPEKQGVRIKVFEKCTGGWRWPKQTDEVDYLPEDIIQHIYFPQPVNNRGTYRIIELESKWGTD